MSLDTAIIQQYYAGILRLQPSAATINAYAQLPSYEAAMDAMMNAAVASVNPITKLYQAAFDRVPDSAGLTNYTAAYGAGAGTMTLQQIANQWTGTIEFTTDYPASMPNADYVGLLYWNVLHRAADPVGAANFTTALNNGTMTRADVLLELSQSPEFAYRIDGHIRGFQEQCALNNPAAYTGTLWDKVPPGPGETFTLTTGIDVFTATTDNATFNAVADAGAANTMNSGDVLTGAGGVNTLNILAQGTTAGLVETNDVQVVNVRSVAASGFSQLLMNGVDVVANNNSLATLAITSANLNTEYGLNNTVNTANGNANLTVTYVPLTGTTDTAKLAINNAGSATITQTLNVENGNTIDAVTLRTAGTNNVVLAAGTAADEITVTGSGANTILVNTAAAANLDFDASATTGTNTLSFTGTLVKSSSTIVGGSGADTLSVSSGVNLNYGTPTMSGVETLSINQTAGTFSVGLGRTTGLTAVNLVAAAGNDGAATTLSQLGNGVGINMTALAANAAGANDFNALTILGSFTGVADQQTINVNTTADLIDAAGLLTTTGLESLNYVVTGDADNFAATLGGVTSTSRLSALTVSTEGFTAATEVNVALGTVTATGATLDVVDFSGANTGVSVAFAAASLNDSAAVLGGSGNDTIDASLVSLTAGTENVTIVGSLGADTMTAIGATANGGSTVFAIAQGDSGITVATADSILGFDDTANTGDYLALGVAGDATANTGNYVEAAGALTFAQALAAANTALTTLAATTLSSQIYSLQVDTGADIGYLFTDYNLDGTADQVVLIQTIATADDFSAANIIA
jgi:Domain of unknown function (DUF4214)